MGTVKIMFASLGAYGHLYPMMPLAIACADAGQEVVIATGKPFLERLPVRPSPATRTVLGALEAGLPQLLLPQGADQFINAETLTTAGAVRALTNEAQQPGAIGEAVQTLLGDCPERQVAARLRDEIATMPAPDEVVPALLDLAGG